MRIRIHLGDEAPRIGQGQRIVEVTSRGPKWVHVRYAPLEARRGKSRRKRNPIIVVNAKFRTDMWAGIERRGTIL